MSGCRQPRLPARSLLTIWPHFHYVREQKSTASWLSMPTRSSPSCTQNRKSSLNKKWIGFSGVCAGHFLLRLTTTTFSTGGSVDSRFSIPTFLTLGFQILAGIQARARPWACPPAPLACEYVYLLVPRSRSLISVMTAIGCLQSRLSGRSAL